MFLLGCLLLAAVVAAPHVLVLERVRPVLAAGIWLGALVLRAVTAVLGAVIVVSFIPKTELFELVTHWCWHTVLPFVAEHLPLDGHAVGGTAVIAPAILLLASTLSVMFGVWRALRAVRLLLERSVIGPGPQESLVLADGEVLVAAAGLRRPKIVVSAGALTTFDDEELAASLSHERGHISRHHRWVLVTAELCRALARFVPGTRRAAQELRFHLERDADRFALERHHEPAVLASAICKAAQARSIAPLTALGGGGVTRRIRALLDGAAASQPVNGLAIRSTAALILALVAILTAALPAVTVAAVRSTDGASVRHCAND